MRRIGKWILIGVGALIVIGIVGSLMSPRDQTAQSTSTPSPTQTSSPASEAESPSPAETATPTPLPTPAFEPITLSGTGDGVPRFTKPEGQPAIATATHQGSSNFAVISLAADGSQNDLLVNTIGNYSGTVLFDHEAGQESVAFEVTADGPWTIVIKPALQARAWDPATALTGHGDDVVLVTPAFDGFTTLRITHNGQSNFAVIAYYGAGRDLLVNEIGPYDGEVPVNADTFVIEVNADGDWTFTRQ